MLTETDPIAALIISDVHLSLKPPIARSAEPNWLATQAGYFRQLEEMLPAWDVPIICCGDLFDRHNPPLELVRWCLDVLPEMYAIPGNHDLPNHRHEDRHKSAFGLLEKVGKVKLIDPAFPTRLPLGSIDPGLVLHGFPCGFPLKPLNVVKMANRGAKNAMHVAVVHQYLWSDKSEGYPGAPVECKLSAVRKNLTGYNAAAFGDNHSGWLYSGSMGSALKLATYPVLNCGCFIRRKSDERKLQPSVGLLYASGRIERRLLDVSDDEWLDAPDTEQGGLVLAGIEDFVAELEQLGEEAVNFPDAVRQYLERNKVGKRVRRQVLAALETAAED